ncbi:hypothetical protein PanWU01x14_157450, partial [Parasponia andersonii]
SGQGPSFFQVWGVKSFRKDDIYMAKLARLEASLVAYYGSRESPEFVEDSSSSDSDDVVDGISSEDSDKDNWVVSLPQ